MRNAVVAGFRPRIRFPDKMRARDHGVVLVCTPIFRDLVNPPRILERDWVAWYGRVPSTRTPPEIQEDLWKNLCELAGVAG